MANFGLSVSDLVMVSNLAFTLYRRCRDAPKEFASLTNEVQNLRNLIDDVRLTVKEHSLNETQRDQLLDIGQCCLDCLVDLEELLQKHASLGIRTIRGLERLKWDKNKVADIRQRLISNIGLLNAFNINLTRSSTVRLERLLKGFIEDVKAGRHEGSILSRETLPGIQRGDDDVWRELKKELEAAGITEEQITENKQMITQRIVDAIQAQVDQNPIVSASFNSAVDGSSSNQWSSPTLISRRTLPSDLDFPGTEFHWARDVVRSLIDLFTDAPKEYYPIQDELNRTNAILSKIDEGLIDLSSLAYHEKLRRKPQMMPLVVKITATLKRLQELIPSLRTSSSIDQEDVTWSQETTLLVEQEHLRHELETSCQQLNSVFSGLGSFVLANIEDRIKILVNETMQKQRSSAILQSWEDLEAEIVDGQEILQIHVQEHKEAIESFLKVLRENVDGFDDDQSARHYRTSSIGDSVSHTGALPFDDGSAKYISSSATTVSQALGQSLPSVTESDDIVTAPGKAVTCTRTAKPKRTSVLFVDLNNTIRSPMAQCYLEYLISRHPNPLAVSFSKVLSRGIYAARPGVALHAGVDFMLRDEGISQNFSKTHTSRRLERRDVEKFEYVLVMDTRMRDDILNLWPSRESLGPDAASKPDVITRDDLMGKVRELGSFGGQGLREVASTETIDGQYWFHVGTKRIYPGFTRCFEQIKTYIAEFVSEVTGFDFRAEAIDSSQELDTREASPELSEDEGYSGIYQHSSWPGEERSEFEELGRIVSNYAGSTKSLTSLDESPLHVTIMADRLAPEESDEILLHKHHEQFHRLVNLLLTDIGDSDFSSLRHKVMEWEADSNRNICPVQSGNAHWILEKVATDSTEACKLCQISGTKCGFVCDAKFEVISAEEADTIAKYLEIAILQSKEITRPSPEEDAQLRKIRDAPKTGPTAPPSIRDDVSVSVRNDKPHLAHEVSKIRERDAQNRQRSAAGQNPAPPVRKIIRRQTDELSVRIKELDNKIDSDATVTPMAGLGLTGVPSSNIEKNRLQFSGKAAGAKTPKTPGKGAKKAPDLPEKQLAVLFLSSWHLYTAVMAEVYLASRISRSMRLALKLCDVVSAGVHPIPDDVNFNPKKLERLFKNHGILDSWPQKPQRLLMADDVIEFDHILVLDEQVDLEMPYTEWADENPDEAEELRESGPDWKTHFRAHIEMLREYDPDENRRAVPIGDPAPMASGSTGSLASKTKLGVPMKAFEKRYDRVKNCVDSWLRRMIGFDVEKNKFL